MVLYGRAELSSWGQLYRDVSSKVKIAKAVVIFIEDDWTRTIWRFSQEALDCLNSAARCTGHENYYGLPENPIDARAQIDRIARLRVDYLSKNSKLMNHSAAYRKLVAPAFRRLSSFLETGNVLGDRAEQFEVSKNVFTNIVNDLGRENVLFIHLPQKDEIISGPAWFGRKADDFIIQNGFAFVNGFKKCGLTLQDYYELDGHPNASGYGKIAICVEHAIKETFNLP